MTSLTANRADNCPLPEVLENIAAGQAVSAAQREHVDTCDRCRRTLERIRHDNSLLAEYLAGPGWHAVDCEEGPGGLDVPGYDILREIHRGGQGVVFQALQRSTNRPVAIKVIRQGAFATDADRVRFAREIETLGQLDHPNIVAVHDAGLASGYHYFVMDYVDGLPLDEAVALESDDGPRRPRIARERVTSTLQTFVSVCDAVHAAHLRGVVHRDLKPSNIRVDRAGNPCVLDFGLAKSIAPSGDSMTRTGQFVGSLPWAAPEQVEGDPDRIDLRSDVYSLGAILYRLLTGAPPFDVGTNLRNTLDDILHREPPRPRTAAAARGLLIDDEIETIILKCLSKDRDRRYQSAGELARDIRRYLAGEAIDAKRDSAWYVIRKTAWKRRRTILAWALPLPLLLIAGLALERSAAAARQAELERSLRQVESDRSAAVSELARRLHARPGSSVESPGGRLDRSNAGAIYADLDAGSFAVADHSVALLLAETLRDRGDIVEAEALVRRAIYLLGRQQGTRHPEIGHMRAVLADILLRRATRMREAQQTAQLAIRELTDSFGATSPDTARGWTLLARIELAAGRATEAREAGLRAVRAAPRRNSLEHADAQLVLARVHAELGSRQDARRDAVDGLRTMLGHAHDTDARLLDSLGLTAELLDLGMLETGELFDPARLRGSFATLGPSGAMRETAAVLRGGADGTLRDQNVVPARFLMIALRERLLGPDDPRLGASLAAAGASLFAASVESPRFSSAGVEEAAGLFERAIPLQISAHGADSPLVGKSYEKLAGCLVQLCRIREAAEWFARDCELWMRQPPEVCDEYQVMLRARWTAWFMTRALAYERALAWTDRALELIGRQVGHDHPGAALMYACRALCLAELGRPAEAFTSEQKAVELLRTQPVPSDQRLECARFLGLAQLRLGRIDEARATLLPARDAEFASESHPATEFRRLEWMRAMLIFARGAEDDALSAECEEYIRRHGVGDIQPNSTP